eukprot:Plantae.Rhodophyta-Purpureofilum_apyrenoidigerum.ctg18549.p1 GENE.Plantae.Rhodophyta-Purpureofilum_apyrenoidigerum.ctg18549~~Plantae.Rhodophyta-Purpureofilum_apyrenoidigerum.ctg18549.p1  ORF type:complete len:1070 (-),score=280.39 Plantae.Rhodophyta-Purpureofilum_apyrenoidigerum.ctg18549:362-3571(-)
MVKSRMSVLDLEVQLRELNKRLVGARVANIYDVDEKLYTVKLTVPPRRDAPAKEYAEGDDVEKKEKDSWKKVMLLIESGSRVHTTLFDRDKGELPSGFALKLRKHLRTKRLNHIQQFDSDRIIDLEFTSATEKLHLIIELYAAGNIILTDDKMQIIALLRIFRPKEGDKYSPRVVGATYPVSSARKQVTISRASVEKALSSADKKQEARKVLAANLSYSIQLLEHALVESGLKVNASVQDVLDCPGVFQGVERSLQRLDRILKGETSDEMPLKGYIVEKKSGESILYEDYTPYLLAQYRGKSVKEFETFDEAVDEFYASVEKQKDEQRRMKLENAAMKKVSKLRNQLDGRVIELQKESESSFEKARLIEDSTEDIDAILTILRSAVAAGMDWQELGRMLKEEQESGNNPLLEIVHSLHLERNELTVMLVANDYEDESDEGRSEKQTRRAKLVDLDLGLTARQNAERYYKQKKVSETKKEKAEEAGKKALKVAEKKAKTEVDKVQAGSSIRQKRKLYWFEKFHWFISSENYLVIGGRDAQQNELIVKRYMSDNDVYLHADIHGAASVVIKNRGSDPIEKIPPLTLSQAGTFAMCRSVAWTSRIVTSAWWVRPSQVSKTAPTGQYLASGSFVVRGKKNFLPPVQLVFGLGMLFKVDESCIASHIGERANRSVDSTINQEQADFDQGGEDVEAEVHGDEDENLDLDEAGSLSEEIVDDAQAADQETDNVEKSEQDEEKDSAAEAEGPSPRGVDSTDIVNTGKLCTPLDEEVQRAAKLFEKFAMNDPSPAEAEVAAESEENGEGSSRRYISSAKRRQQKARNAAEGTENTKANNGQTSGKSTSKSVPTVPRGKRTKLRRMKKKYADQDEQERELALMALGAAPVSKAGGSSEESSDAEQATGSGRDEKVETQEGSDMKKPSDQTKRRERAEVQHVKEEEGIVDLEMVGAEIVSALDRLTGQPLDNDILLNAIPVCAPYNVLASYKYKVKLLPGSLKRGKAYQQSVSYFGRMAGKEEVGMREWSLIKSVPDNEALPAVLPNVRVTAAGLQGAQQAAKSGKKVAKKSKKRFAPRA